MAKQDLVVKLMLDSGAFGQDIREAERKAKQFSDNMKSAGKTAGDLGKEIGLSAGAFTKLGGAMMGVGGVVAAVGAFKSVMESTHASSKEFHSTIAGFEGVLDTFQRSLANFDFTTFINGIGEVYRRSKAAKEALMDASMSSVAYSFLNTQDMERVKAYELEYRDPKTTDARRVEIKTEVDKLIKSMRENVKFYTNSVNLAFLTGIESIDTKIKKNGISPSDAMEYLRQAMLYRLSGQDEQDMKDYEEVMKTVKAKEKNIKKGIGYKGRTYAQQKALAADLEQYIKNNQSLFFRNALYQFSDEELKQKIDMVLGVSSARKAVDDIALQVQGWSAPKKEETKTEEKLIEGSIAYLEELIADREKRRKKVKFEGEEWKSLTEELKKYNAELKRMKDIQAEYDGTAKKTGENENEKKKEEKVLIEGSIAYLEELIKTKKEERDELVFESEAWKETTAELKTYTAELERLKKIQAVYDGTASQTGAGKSVAFLSGQISELETSRSLYSVDSDEWKEKTKQLYEYKAALEQVLRLQAEYESKYKTSDDKWTEKMSNMNVVLSSSVSMLNGLGSAFAACEDETVRAMGGITNAMADIASGIMSYVQIQQAAAAASGTASAAALPYPYNLAAIASVLGTILAVFSNIKSMTAGKFAEGGIVGGTSYSGDKLFAMVNSGEMILNKRQQSNLSNMLGGGGQVEFHISGDSLVGVLNNRQNKRHLTR